MKQGWIKLHRQLQDHWLWDSSGELSKLEAWLDICLSCNHSEQKVNIKNQLITVKCGESVQSLTTWSKRWNWNKSKVVRFLGLLEKDGMIESMPCSKTKHIRVCNYATYQHERNAGETQVKQKRNASETKTKTNKNVKNVKNEKNKTSDDVERVWNHYPNKQGKKSAIKGIIRAIENHGVEEIIRRVIAYAKLTDPKYYAHGSTYFNGDRYEDDLTPPKQTPQQMRGY